MQESNHRFLKGSARFLVALLLTAGALAGFLPPQAQTVPALAASEMAPVALNGVHSWVVQRAPSVERAGPSSQPFRVYLPEVYAGYSPPSKAFAVHMQAATTAKGLDQAVGAGAYWIRFPTLRWDLIESTPGTYWWGAVDEASLINAATSGRRVIAIVYGTPQWAQKVAGYYCGPIKEDALDDFARFLQAAVQRYSVRPYSVRHWEIWNEPDVAPEQVSPQSIYGCWGDPDDAYYGGGYFAEMLKEAQPAIKGADPSAQVLVGGLLLDCDPDNPPPGKDCSSARFLEGILRNGGGPYFDMVSFHAYTYYGGSLGQMWNTNWGVSDTGLQPKVTFLRSILSEYGLEEKPLLNTESALLCATATQDCLQTQAMYAGRAFAQAAALKLATQVYYEMINEEWRHVGLLLADLTPKPVYNGLKTAASFLGFAQYIRPVTGYPPGITGYSFKNGGRAGSLDVLWSSDGLAHTTTLPAGATAYDLYGTSKGSGTITVDSSTVYVVKP